MESVLRSFDIVTALAQIRGEDEGWGQERVLWLLDASAAEHAASMDDLVRARLAAPTGARVLRESLVQFLVHGVPHVFPGRMGGPAQGVPTGGGARLFESVAHLVGNDLVWPTDRGSARGRSVEPLDARVPDVALRDDRMHALLSAVDLLRVGRARGRRLARMYLEQVLMSPQEPLYVLALPDRAG